MPPKTREDIQVWMGQQEKWQEEQDHIQSVLERLRKRLVGNKIIQVVSRYGDFVLVFDDANTLRFAPEDLKELEELF